MRRHILGLVIAGCVLQTVSAQRQAQSDQATVTPNDVLADKLWRIAVATNTRIGFEATDHVRMGELLKSIPTLSVSTLEDGLNAAVGADDRYEWRKVDDVVVVRPKRAWDDRSNPFNRSMRNVEVANRTPPDVPLGLRDFIYTDRFVVDPGPTGIPVSFHIQSATVIEVLNELMVTADQMLWIGSYRRTGQPADRFPSWDLSLELRDAFRLTALSSSHPPAKK
jgi:hypothetical protein